VIIQGVTLPTLYWPADKVGSQTPGRLRPGDLSLVDYNTCHTCRSARSESTDVLSCTPSLEVVLDKVIWKVFGRSCWPPTRSVGPTVRWVGLLIGRTHLSGTGVSLIGGDPGVSMSHTMHKFTFIRGKRSLGLVLLGSFYIYLPMGPWSVVLYMVPCSFYFYLLQKISAQQILEKYLKIFERFSLLF
jgi:hypothetical protein